jgi:hypothetical protein
VGRTKRKKGAVKSEKKIVKMRIRLSQNQPGVSHLYAARSSNNNRRRPRSTHVVKYFKEFNSPRFKSSTLILFKLVVESAFIPFVSFCDLDNNTFKGLTSLLSVEQEIQYDEHT